jgi:pimeloyl-ACP methyl ester carboxylesterase
MKFLDVPQGILSHSVEKRGLVTVPLDWKNPSSEKLKIFYRFIPVLGKTHADTANPILVIVNGGPGAASGMYRPYDYDYASPSADHQDREVLKTLSQYFRILIMDQRGTPGYSAPLDMRAEDLDPEKVAKYFGADHLALDQQAVIEEVIPPSEPFFMIYQSYGGMVGMRYLTMPEITRRPKGGVFTSSALPHENPLPAFLGRRQEQRRLNQSLAQFSAAIPKKLLAFRDHLSAHGLSAEGAHYLWELLGKGEDGKWQADFDRRLDKLLVADKASLEAFVNEHTADVSVLNYILSSSEMSPGQTDRNMARKVVKEVPYENWMVDEQNCWLRIADKEPLHIKRLLDNLDVTPPTPAFYEPISVLKERFRGVRVLFTLGDNDAFLPTEKLLPHVEQFQVPGVTEIKLLPGGHKAAFLPVGAAYVADWARR